MKMNAPKAPKMPAKMPAKVKLSPAMAGKIRAKANRILKDGGL